jgi:hypothetical protein
MRRSSLNPEFDPSAPAPRWSRRSHFLTLVVVAGIGWLILALIPYFLFFHS